MAAIRSKPMAERYSGVRSNVRMFISSMLSNILSTHQYDRVILWCFATAEGANVDAPLVACAPPKSGHTTYMRTNKTISSPISGVQKPGVRVSLECVPALGPTRETDRCSPARAQHGATPAAPLTATHRPVHPSSSAE